MLRIIVEHDPALDRVTIEVQPDQHLVGRPGGIGIRENLLQVADIFADFNDRAVESAGKVVGIDNEVDHAPCLYINGGTVVDPATAGVTVGAGHSRADHGRFAERIGDISFAGRQGNAVSRFHVEEAECGGVHDVDIFAIVVIAAGREYSNE